ncbi:NUDIX domain-containing protein [Levilactobacillus fujinensis]|uniref:NUDIX domain-containing protein n=1 Tax=Levilactobacillus fujinensis TaxID=2486024 RepID=A0ABW1TG54_9LACO|nr:NUDIX domain-containing protein [Levilactobacillus fujinensis]
MFFPIGGILAESEELPKDAAIRECKEEIELEVTINKIIGEDSNFDNSKKTARRRLCIHGLFI